MSQDTDRVIAGVGAFLLAAGLSFCHGCTPADEPGLTPLDMSPVADLSMDLRPICDPRKCPACEDVKEVCIVNALGYCCVSPDMSK